MQNTKQDTSKAHCLPGFIVMNIPHESTSLISPPSKTNWVERVESAWRMLRICCATTDSTSMLIRLNSSKQPQAPVCARPKGRGGMSNVKYQTATEQHTLLCGQIKITKGLGASNMQKSIIATVVICVSRMHSMAKAQFEQNCMY